MRFNLRTKLIGSFAIVLLLTLVVGLIGIYTSKTTITRVEKLVEQDVKGLSILGDIARKISFIRSNSLLHLITESRDDKNRYESEIADWQSKIRTDLDNLEKIYRDQATLDKLAEFRSAWETYVSIWDEQVKPLSKANSNEEAFALARKKGAAGIAAQEVVYKLNKLNDAIVSKATRRIELAEQDFRKSQIILPSVILLAIILGLAFGIKQSSLIAGPVNIVSKAAQLVAAGDLDQSVKVRTGDEIESMADSFNTMISNMKKMVEELRHEITEREKAEKLLQEAKDGLEVMVGKRTSELRMINEQLWREITERKKAEKQIQHQIERITALRNIDMAITSSLDVRVTLQVFLDQLTNVLRVDAASVLLLNPNTLNLEYVTSRGFRTSALQHTKLRLGEGHAGRAALEHSVVSIPNLAEEINSFSRSKLLASEEFVSYYAMPLITKGNIKGILEVFHRAPLDPNQEWLDFLEALTAQAAIAIDNASLFDNLQRSNIDLILSYDATIEGWSRALDYRDKETEGHSQRVTEITVKMASAMGMSDKELVHMRRGALLHDIGKLGVPDAILFKSGKLDDEEWEIMHKHPVLSYELLSPIAFLRPALDIPYCHHEKWDGTGYPRGLKGEQIPLAARIFAVVDVWDALSSDRPYRPAWSEERIMEYLREQAGKYFDPKVVEVFLKFLSEQEP